MNRYAPLLFTLGCLGLAACGGSETADNQALANASVADPMANQMMNDPNNPFAQSEMQMNQRMMAAVGVDAGDSWVRKMIEHHQGAIDMSRVFLQQNPSGDVAKLAQQTIDKQTREISDLRKLIKEGSPNQQSAELYRPAMMQMHQAMMAAKASDLSQTFLRKMLEHHRGGVTLSEVALNNGVTGDIQTHARKTRGSQAKEAQMVEAMLRGEPMAQAVQEATPKPAASAQAATSEPAAPKPSAAKPATAEPKRTATAKPKTEPTPPASTCTPEHRAMGHC